MSAWLKKKLNFSSDVVKERDVTSTYNMLQIVSNSKVLLKFTRTRVD